MIKFGVLDRFTGAVKFTADIDCADEADIGVKLGLAVRWGIENGVDLRRTDLQGADLQEVNLKGINLQEANLDRANLRYANLSIANLHEANLQGVDLRLADLSLANLHGSNLQGSILHQANLNEANLNEANLRGGKFCFASFREASLKGANLSGANLKGADLSHANLRGANLSGADLYCTTGNNREVKSYQCGAYLVNIYGDRIQIGCKNYTVDEWSEFDDDTIAEMDKQALAWAKIWKPILLQIMEANKVALVAQVQ